MRATRMLTLLLVLQGVILLGQWTGNGPITALHAQVPDAGAQRNQMLEELKTLNSKMDKLIDLLESGKVQVRVITPDEKAK